MLCEGTLESLWTYLAWAMISIQSGVTPSEDWRGGAGWRATIRSHESWLAELAAAQKSVPDVFKIKGMRLEGIMIDTLHAVDRGLASQVMANVFVEIMALGHWSSNQKARAAGLQEDM